MKYFGANQPFIITPECNATIHRFLTERLGIVIHSHQEEKLKSHIIETCKEHGFQTCASYVKTLLESNTHSAIVENLIDAVTVDESYFFRDEKQMGFLKNYYLPKIINIRRKQGLRTLRVWSAGCSNGQEIYSIAIMLNELLSDFSQWNLHLLATDLNIRSVARARKGKYGKLSFRGMDEKLIEKYFVKDGHYFQLDPLIKRTVTFNYLNLTDDAYPSLMTETCGLDLILCRNVFIYFDADLIRKVLHRFSYCLLPGGCLLLGPSDIFHEKVPELHKHQHSDVFFYERPLEDGSYRSHQDRQPAKEQPKPAPKVTPTPAQPTPPAKPIAEPATKPTATNSEKKVRFEQLQNCLKNEQWQTLLNESEQALQANPDNSDLFLYKAKALANLGQLEAAEEACDKSIELNKLNEKPYLLKALIAMENDQADIAQQCLEKSLFLNPEYIEARYQLGLLWLRQGNDKKGLHALQVALKKLEKADLDLAVDNAPGSTLGQLADVLKSEIRSLEQ